MKTGTSMQPPSTVRSIEELKRYIGMELGVGPWKLITQELIDAFAEVSGDHQWIHVDRERSRTSPFGTTIAHGFLMLVILGLLSRERDGVRVELPRKMALNYGVNRVRFITPVPSGSRIRARTRLLDVQDKGNEIYHIIYEQTVELEGAARPAMVAETIARNYM